ncbi:hypothetical protein D9M72_322830 [compost metagenome]
MKARIEPAEEGEARLAAIAKERGTQGRAQGQRVEGGEGDGDRNRQGELVVEAAGDARNEGDRDEHGEQHGCRGDNRAGHLLHGLFGGGKRRQAGLELALDVLDHHDRVVDHQTDGKHHAEQAQHVEREAEEIHDDERRNQRNRNGDRRNDGGAQVLQEDEDDENDEGKRLEQGKDHILHRRRDKTRGVVEHVIGDAGGETLRQLVHFRLHAALQVERVGARRLEDGKHDALLAVEGDR